MKQRFTRTRLAPTPSGYLHLGNLASFILTCTLAEQQGAKILLRIDDLDQARVRKEYVDDVYRTLGYFDLPWHLGPRTAEDLVSDWSQQSRRKLYNTALDQLRQQKLVYACDCSRKHLTEHHNCTCYSQHLSLDKPGVAWRLVTDDTIQLQMPGVEGQPKKGYVPASMRDPIVRKKDGEAAYQLSSVVDDGLFKVDLIVRGADLLESSWLQLYLSRCLPEDPLRQVHFIHHPLVQTDEGAKLSKSAGDISIQHLKASGHSVSQILDILAKRLGAQAGYHHWRELGHWMLKHWQ